MSDYKYDIQMKAEMAAEELGMDFYSLPKNEQCRLYTAATEDYFASKVDEAMVKYDYLRK